MTFISQNTLLFKHSYISALPIVLGFYNCFQSFRIHFLSLPYHGKIGCSSWEFWCTQASSRTPSLPAEGPAPLRAPSSDLGCATPQKLFTHSKRTKKLRNPRVAYCTGDGPRITSDSGQSEVAVEYWPIVVRRLCE